MAKVQVKLNARCLVDDVERGAGEIVEIESAIAKDFGTVIEPDVPEPVEPPTESGGDKPSQSPLARPLTTKMRKAALVAEAQRVGAHVTPDSMTNQQIIDAIEAAEKIGVTN